MTTEDDRKFEHPSQVKIPLGGSFRVRCGRSDDGISKNRWAEGDLETQRCDAAFCEQQDSDRHLLSLCAVAQVPVIDEQTIYDPNDRDDKLLLEYLSSLGWDLGVAW